MNLTTLTAKLKESLHSAADLIGDVENYEFSRFISLAVSHFTHLKPRTLVGSDFLEPGVSLYEAPEDFVDFKYSLYGSNLKATRKPWEPGYPNRTPRVTVIQGNPAQLSLSFPPTSDMIGCIGSKFDFYYYGAHLVDGSGSTIPSHYEKDLLLAAQAEVMKEIGFDKVGKVTTKDPYSGITRAAHPSVIYQEYMDRFKESLCGPL